MKKSNSYRRVRQSSIAGPNGDCGALIAALLTHRVDRLCVDLVGARGQTPWKEEETTERPKVVCSVVGAQRHLCRLRKVPTNSLRKNDLHTGGRGHTPWRVWRDRS